MNTRNVNRMLACCLVAVVALGGIAYAQSPKGMKKSMALEKKAAPCQCLADTKVITFYDDQVIPPGIGISGGAYMPIDGYRYINIFVEFEQTSADEKPVSLGVMFAFSSDGKLGSRRYFNFEQNFNGTANPQMITLSGEGSWHGAPHNRSSYTARFPVMGPYIQVFPYNNENKERKITIKAYLTT